MKAESIRIDFEEYRSLEELDAPDRSLAEAALEARKGSYAPYSHFNVGAAVRLEDGTTVRGANQENAAYPSGLCAERTALFAAGANYPDRAIVAIAIAGGPEDGLCEFPASPCGACRQVMAEYQSKSGKPMSILLIGRKKILKFKGVEQILPLIFNSLKV